MRADDRFRQKDAPRSEDEVRVVPPDSLLAEAPLTDVAANSPEPATSSRAAIDAARPPAERPAADHGKTEPASGATIRVDLERVDRLINLVGELVINQAMLSPKVMEAGVARTSSIDTVLGALEQLTPEIQEGVMATRAQPVKPLFQRMARIVRELAEETNKIRAFAHRRRDHGSGSHRHRTATLTTSCFSQGSRPLRRSPGS